MATKTRSGGSTAIQNENFKPISEWKEELGANILLLYLPGFEKEQMKITYVHSSRTIRVLGERRISNNQSVKFSESFSIPQNSDVQKINAKFQTGTLTITIPKLTITKPSTANSQHEKKETQPLKKPSTLTDDPLITKKHENLESNEPLVEKDETNSKKRKESLEAPSDDLESIKKRKEPLEAPSDDQESIKKRKEPLKAPSDDQESIKKRKEPLEAPSDDQESIKKRKEGEDLEKIKSYKDLVEKGEKVRKSDNSKKTAMGFGMETSEDKQSLVNIGVAILVIAALGAYISYTYGSSANSKH